MFLIAAKKPARLRIEKLLELLRLKAAQGTSQGNAVSDLEIDGSFVHLVPPLDSQIEELLNRYAPRLRLELFKFDYVSKEAEAADSALALYREGRSTLDLLRKCEESSECGKPFFATRPDQKFCSPKCRHKALEKTEKFKESRKLYAREQYWRERDADLRNQIENLPKTREGQKTRAQLEEKRRAATAKLKAAKVVRSA